MRYLSCRLNACSRRSGNHSAERRKLILGGVSCIAGAMTGSSLAAGPAAHFDGPRKINLSGRQRMLIQRVGKFVCLAYLTPEPQSLITAADEALSLHQRTEAGLRGGDVELGLEAETNVLVIHALTQARLAFKPYGEVIHEVVDRRSVDPEHLEKIAQLNDPALIAMDAAVNVIERIYKGEELTERLAMLINIAGRQRMFTQRMILQLCLYLSVQRSEQMKQQIIRTMNRFDVSLNILRRVTPVAVPAPENKSLVSSLGQVQSNWGTLRNLILKAAGSRSGQSSEDILGLDRRAEDLLKDMNDIVLLYEGAGG